MIELFSANTPNGWKISIMLEEIGYEYKLTPVDIYNSVAKTNAIPNKANGVVRTACEYLLLPWILLCQNLRAVIVK